MSPNVVPSILRAARNRLCPGFDGLASSRRDFLRRTSLGFGWLAFVDLTSRGALAATPLQPPHFRPAQARHFPVHGRRRIARRYV